MILRQSLTNPLDFSVILSYCPPDSNQVIRLRRYNGKHEHTNPLEHETFYDFHVHQATERYQVSGNRVDTFAERTDRYADMRQALECLIADCAMRLPPQAGAPLFDSAE